MNGSFVFPGTILQRNFFWYYYLNEWEKKKEMLREINGLINLQMKKKVVSINLASL